MSYVPAELTGLWRREVITAPGVRDETSRVLWLQARSWYADIRVPIDRPGGEGRRGFADYSEAELVELARIQGFAGELTAADGVCLWRRDLDHQPPGADPDEARFSVSGEVMVEDGIHADYQEIWRREPQSQAPLAAFRLKRDPQGREGLLILGGRHMLEFVARPGPAPQGASLQALVERELAAGRRPAAEALLSTRIRYMTRSADGGWTTVLSSLPWLEGAPVRPRLDTTGGRLAIGEETGVWSLLDATPLTASDV